MPAGETGRTAVRGGGPVLVLRCDAPSASTAIPDYGEGKASTAVAPRLSPTVERRSRPAVFRQEPSLECRL